MSAALPHRRGLRRLTDLHRPSEITCALIFTPATSDRRRRERPLDEQVVKNRRAQTLLSIHLVRAPDAVFSTRKFSLLTRP